MSGPLLNKAGCTSPLTFCLPVRTRLACTIRQPPHAACPWGHRDSLHSSPSLLLQFSPSFFWHFLHSIMLWAPAPAPPTTALPCPALDVLATATQWLPLAGWVAGALPPDSCLRFCLLPGNRPASWWDRCVAGYEELPAKRVSSEVWLRSVSYTHLRAHETA